MSKIFKPLIVTSFVTCGLSIMLPENSFGMYGLTQEEANKEFGKKQAGGYNITPSKPLPDVKPATDAEQKRWEKSLAKELNKGKK